jgi:hypothetical protein
VCRLQESGAGGKRCRRGYMGHLFIMCQAIVETSRPQGSEEGEPESTAQGAELDAGEWS